jgi:hypothetical protein
LVLWAAVAAAIGIDAANMEAATTRDGTARIRLNVDLMGGVIDAADPGLLEAPAASARLAPTFAELEKSITNMDDPIPS